MFHYIDLNNLQKYFDDAGLDYIAPVKFEGSFVEVIGNCYNFVKRSPSTFNIVLCKDDSYVITVNDKQTRLNYENDICKVEQL